MEKPTIYQDVRSNTLLPFFLLTFVIAWGIIAVLILFPDQVERMFGPISGTNPLFILAVYAPAIAAFILVVKSVGWAGLRSYLTRALLWRVSWRWYVFILLGIPALFYLSAFLKGTLFTEPFPFSTVSLLLSALGLMLIVGPVEEFGWRGFALPLLQRHFTPLYASVVLGLVWGLWHLPAFFLSGVPQSNWSFIPFFIASVALSVIVTPLFNASGGSILLPMLYHFQLNNPIWPDSQPHYYLVFTIAAALIIYWCWSELTSKERAVAQVIPPITKRPLSKDKHA